MKLHNYNTGYILLISLVSAMGGLLFGYDWVVIGGAKPFYEAYFDIATSAAMQGWAMSSALLGCLAGAILSGSMADRFGRKKLLATAAILFLASAVLTGGANNFPLFIIARIFGGIGIGVASSLSPMYIAEVAPGEMRGRFVALNQLTIVLGILGAQVANWQIAQVVPLDAGVDFIRESWNGQMGWRWMFWAGAVPALFFTAFVFAIPESPRWLAIRGFTKKSTEIFTRIVGTAYAEQEIGNILRSASQRKEEGGLKDLLAPRMRGVLLIGIVVAAFQQWCGLNVVFNYAQEIFTSAGYGLSDTMFNIVVTGSANLVFTILAFYLVDRFGRKALMLLGAGGLAGIYAVMGSLYYFEVGGMAMLIMVVAAIGCYAVSLAPVTWVILSEIFPTRVRGAAMAVATFALWAACFILTYTFPLLNISLGSYGTFWLYGVICLAGFVFVWKKLPQTKGRSLEQIERELVYKEKEPVTKL